MELPTTLILSPGGVKGFLHLGALSVLDDKGILNNINRYVGISIGAVISLLLILGYNVIDILYHSMDFPDIFEDYMKISNIEKIVELTKETFKNGGVVPIEKVEEHLSEKVIHKFGTVVSLKELYDQTKIDFVCVALNITKDHTEYISWLNYPEMSCVEAVMLSMNIPLVFHKMKYNNQLFVDGALGNPLPIDVYPDNTLALYIESNFDDIDTSVWSYLFKVLTCAITQITKKNISEKSDGTVVIRLMSIIKSTLGTGLSVADKLSLYYHGYNLANKFFQEKNPYK
jgi:predicted acylesterase/phospholipase RssA